MRRRTVTACASTSSTDVERIPRNPSLSPELERRLQRLEQRIVLGVISGAHGVRGEVRVRIAVDSAEPLFELSSAWLGSGPGDPEARRFEVLECSRARSGEVRLRLSGVTSREDVGGLIGRLLMAPSSVLPDLPEGEFYGYELIGFRVESEAGEVVGTGREIWETGAHDVLLVEDEEGVRRLIPTAQELVNQIDREARRIVVVDLPGLLDPC
jgi:16S rRNA processing protein RimM